MPDVVDPIVLEKGLKATFYQAYQGGTPFYPTLCTEVPSAATSEKYGWLGSAPAMREWVDERVPKGLLSHDYTIVNKHWEASISIDADDLDDDQVGQLPTRVRDMASRAARHPDKLLTDLIVAGESTLCYDGQYFFDTDHSEGDSGTQDNDLSVNVSDTSLVTVAEAKTIFNTVLGAMLSYLDDRGEPFLEEWQIDSANFSVMVPPEHREPWQELLTSALISNTDNVYKNKARLVVNARLTAATKLYFFFHGAPIRPFIHQNRQPVRTSMLSRDSETSFMRRKLVFGADARYNQGYGLWQYAVLVTLT